MAEILRGRAKSEERVVGSIPPIFSFFSPNISLKLKFHFLEFQLEILELCFRSLILKKVPFLEF